MARFGLQLTIIITVTLSIGLSPASVCCLSTDKLTDVWVTSTQRFALCTENKMRKEYKHLAIRDAFPPESNKCHILWIFPSRINDDPGVLNIWNNKQ